MNISKALQVQLSYFLLIKSFSSERDGRVGLALKTYVNILDHLPLCSVGSY